MVFVLRNAAYSSSSKPSAGAGGTRLGASSGAPKLDGSYAPLGLGGSGGGRSFTPDPSLKPSLTAAADFRAGGGAYASLLRSTPTPPKADRYGESIRIRAKDTEMFMTYRVSKLNLLCVFIYTTSVSNIIICNSRRGSCGKPCVLRSMSKSAGLAVGAGAGTGASQSTAYKAGPTLGLGGSGAALDGGVRSRDIKREAERIMNELEIERRKKQLLAPAPTPSPAAQPPSALQLSSKSLLSPAAAPVSAVGNGFLGGLGLGYGSARATPPAAPSPAPAGARFDTRTSIGPTARVRHLKQYTF